MKLGTERKEGQMCEVSEREGGGGRDVDSEERHELKKRNIYYALFLFSFFSIFLIFSIF